MTQRPYLLRTIASAALAPLGSALLSCSNCEFETKQVDAFLLDDSNRRCASDSDCVLVGVGCLDVKRAACNGLVSLGKEAATSSEWQQITGDAFDCNDNEVCEDCGLKSIATCVEGICH